MLSGYFRRRSLNAKLASLVCPSLGSVDCPWPWIIHGHGLTVHGHGLSIAMDCPWPWTVHSHGLSMAMDCPWPALIPALARSGSAGRFPPLACSGGLGALGRLCPPGPPVTLALAPRRTYSREHLLTLTHCGSYLWRPLRPLFSSTTWPVDRLMESQHGLLVVPVISMHVAACNV